MTEPVTRTRNVEAVRRLMTLPLAPVRWEGLQVYDREIVAHKAASMLRRGKSVDEVCAALRIGRDTLRHMAADFDFSLPKRRPPHWPKPEDRGDNAYVPPHNLVRTKAARAAAAQLKANGYVPKVKALKAGFDAIAAKSDDPPRKRLVITYVGEIPTAPSSTTDEIIDEVCAKHRVARKDVLSVIRSRYVIPARHEAMYRIREEKCLSWAQIGRIFDRDHTSVLHGWRKHKASIEAAEARKAMAE